MQTKIFFLIIVISIYVLPLFSQNSYQELKNKIDTVKIDTTTFGEIYGTQLDEIFMDMKQINEALAQKSDSLTMVIANMQDILLKNNSKVKLYLYAVIGSIFLIVLFALLWIIFMIKAFKNKKLYQQASLEIGKGKAEIEKLNVYINSEKEQHQYSKEMLEKEKNNIISELKQVSQQFEQTQQIFKQKENEWNENKNNLEQTIEQFKQENRRLNDELSQWVAKNEETAILLNELNERVRVKNEQLLNLENELNNLTQTRDTYLAQLEELRKKNEELQMQIAEANATKEKVNEELKKFVQELQTMLPLPKR